MIGTIRFVNHKNQPPAKFTPVIGNDNKPIGTILEIKTDKKSGDILLKSYLTEYKFFNNELYTIKYMNAVKLLYNSFKEEKLLNGIYRDKCSDYEHLDIPNKLILDENNYSGDTY